VEQFFARFRNEREGAAGMMHWNDAEFQTIMKAFDQLFADQHWT
jgi:hypothetical protein